MSYNRCPDCGGPKGIEAWRCIRCAVAWRLENGSHHWAQRYADLQSAHRAAGLCEKVTAGGKGIVDELTVCTEKATKSGLCPAHRWQVMRW